MVHIRLVLGVSLILLLSGCFSAPAHVADWEAEADRHGTMGQAAKMALQAPEYVVAMTEATGTLTGDLLLENTAAGVVDTPMALFHGTLPGEAPGLLVVEGAQVELTSDGLAGLPVMLVTGDGELVHIALGRADERDKPQVEHPADDDAWFVANGAHGGRTQGTVTVTAADRARIVRDGTSTDLELPVTLQADHVALPAGARFVQAAFTVEAGRFGYGGDTTSGQIERAEGAAIERPQGVFGADATLVLDGDTVRTDDFRLHQALTEDGYAVDADMEFRLDPTAYVDAGNTTWQRLDFRERGYLGAAVLQNVTVSGPGRELVKVPLESPPWLIEQLWDELPDEPWAAPFVALPLAIASPWLLLAEAFFVGMDCIFNDCPSEHPLPAWYEPGTIGHAYVQIDAAGAEPGTYTAMIAIKGANGWNGMVPIDVVVE